MNVKTLFMAAAFAVAATGAADAAFTPVNPLGGSDGRERCLAGSADGLSVGNCPAGGTYGNQQSIIGIIAADLGVLPGSITRVDDTLDTVWANTFDDGGLVLARARYAGDSSELGYSTTPGGYNKLLDVLGNGKIAVEDTTVCTGATAGDCEATALTWTTIPLGAGIPFIFVLNNLTTSQMISSSVFVGGYANSGLPSDWMVTYKVSDDHYIIAWEDRLNLDAQNRPNDWDYNDYVFELKFVRPVPEPGMLALFGMALFGLGAAARRRARQ